MVSFTIPATVARFIGQTSERSRLKDNGIVVHPAYIHNTKVAVLFTEHPNENETGYRLRVFDNYLYYALEQANQECTISINEETKDALVIVDGVAHKIFVEGEVYTSIRGVTALYTFRNCSAAIDEVSTLGGKFDTYTFLHDDGQWWCVSTDNGYRLVARCVDGHLVQNDGAVRPVAVNKKLTRHILRTFRITDVVADDNDNIFFYTDEQYIIHPLVTGKERLPGTVLSLLREKIQQTPTMTCTVHGAVLAKALATVSKGKADTPDALTALLYKNQELQLYDTNTQTIVTTIPVEVSENVPAFGLVFNSAYLAGLKKYIKRDRTYHIELPKPEQQGYLNGIMVITQPCELVAIASFNVRTDQLHLPPLETSE